MLHTTSDDFGCISKVSYRFGSVLELFERLRNCGVVGLGCIGMCCFWDWSSIGVHVVDRVGIR